MESNKKIFSFIGLVCLMFVMLFGIFGQANAQPEVLKECIKIRQNFTLEIVTKEAVFGTSPTPEVRKDVNFVSGAIIASKKITDGTPACERVSGDGGITTEAIPEAGGDLDKAKNYHLASSKEYGVIGMFNVVYNVTNWIFFIMTIVAVLMIVFGGFTYITAAGDPAKAGKGKSILTYAIIGLAIALIAKLIPSLVRFILGV